MTKKLQCIKSLKSKLMQMQRQLERIDADPRREENSRQHERMWFNKTTTVKNFNSTMIETCVTKSPSWKNPTFWGSNPISGKENTTMYTPTKWNKHKSPRNIKTELSPEANEVKKFGNERFYCTLKEQVKQSPKIASPSPKNIKSQKYLFSFYGSQQRERETPRFEKIKTFNHPPSDPILNPEKPMDKGKKMVIKKPLASTVNLVENPKSNPTVYCFNGKVATLSPKTSNLKNLSPNVKKLLSTSLQEKANSPKRASCKKHFTRYFKETYQSKWN